MAKCFITVGVNRLCLLPVDDTKTSPCFRPSLPSRPLLRKRKTTTSSSMRSIHLWLHFAGWPDSSLLSVGSLVLRCSNVRLSKSFSFFFFFLWSVTLVMAIQPKRPSIWKEMNSRKLYSTGERGDWPARLVDLVWASFQPLFNNRPSGGSILIFGYWRDPYPGSIKSITAMILTLFHRNNWPPS